MKKSIVTLAAFAVFLLISVPQTQAHAIWFAQRATQTALIYGIGADDLDMVKRLQKIESFNAYDANLKSVDAELIQAGPLVLAVSDELPPVLTAVMNNGVWSKTPDGEWHDKGMDEVPDAIVSERTFKYAVHVRGELNVPLGNLPGQTLQIIPEGGKLPTMMGDSMTVKVLLQGKPVAGAAIKRDFVNDPDQEPILTGVDGTATFKVRNQGLNVIEATVDGPPDDPAKVTKIEHSATLSFVLGHSPE